MPSGRSRNNAGSSRYRTHDRDELLELVLRETGEAAEREHKTITQEFERRKESRGTSRQLRQDQRKREIIEAQRRETERQSRARARREAVLRQIEEDELRATGQWTPPAGHSVVPFDTSELGARTTTATSTDEWVVSQLTMASVERRLGIHRNSIARHIKKTWIGAGAAIAVALAVTVGIGAGSSRPDIDPGAYAVTTVSVAELSSPTSTIAFRAPAPAVSRRHGAESSRSIRSAVEHSTPSDNSGESDEDTTRPRRNLTQPLHIDLGDAENLWDRGSE